MSFLDRLFGGSKSVVYPQQQSPEEMQIQAQEEARRQAADFFERNPMHEPTPEDTSYMDMTPQDQREQASLFPDNDSVLATLYAEAKGEPDEGVQAVFDTIRNRSNTHSRPWTSTVDVPYQYEGYGNPQYQQAMGHLGGGEQLQGPALEELLRMQEIMEMDRPLQDNANMYINKELQTQMGRPIPPWAQGDPMKEIGSHSFYHGRTR